MRALNMPAITRTRASSLIPLIQQVVLPRQPHCSFYVVWAKYAYSALVCCLVGKYVQKPGGHLAKGDRVGDELLADDGGTRGCQCLGAVDTAHLGGDFAAKAP